MLCFCTRHTFFFGHWVQLYYGYVLEWHLDLELRGILRHGLFRGPDSVTLEIRIDMCNLSSGDCWTAFPPNQ